MTLAVIMQIFRATLSWKHEMHHVDNPGLSGAAVQTHWNSVFFSSQTDGLQPSGQLEII